MNIYVYWIFYAVIFFSIILTVFKYLTNVYLEYKNTSHNKSISSNSTVNLSIHIPTCAEPFEVVKNTLDAIIPQLNVNDEIIVLDNNHTNVALYQPLQEYCDRNLIQFYHFDYIPGFKAGAMNKALEVTSEIATHIFVIDCDYQLQPGALKCVREDITQNHNYGFLQYPQAYLGDDKMDVKNELNTYFEYNLELNNNKYNSLGTGTLCCIDIQVLKAIGGWPTNSITEDAQFGLDVQKVDKRGLYVPKVIGKGYLPGTIKDFIRQRQRWIYGNAEVLVHLIKRDSYRMNKLYNFSQLCTWLNFTGLTILIHIILVVLFLFDIESFSLLCLIYVHYLILTMFSMRTFFKVYNFNKGIRAFLIHCNFFWISSFHWIPSLFNFSKGFIRTPKLNNVQNSSLYIPKMFLLLNIVTLIIYFNSYLIVGFTLFFISIELFSRFFLLKNFK